MKTRVLELGGSRHKQRCDAVVEARSEESYWPGGRGRLSHYRLMLRKHIVPALGERLVADLEHKDILSFHTGLHNMPTVANRAAEHLTDCLAHSAKSELPAHAFLDRLLDIELNEREERRVKTSLRLSGLPTGQTLASFDFAFQPSVERSQIDTLGTGTWVRAKETLLIQRPPGVGKTHLSVALGVKAIENGFSVTFYRLEELLAALRANAGRPRRRTPGRCRNGCRPERRAG